MVKDSLKSRSYADYSSKDTTTMSIDIKEALMRSRPRLFRGKQIVPIDCRPLYDPGRSKHLGIHPDILGAAVESPQFKAIAFVM